MARRPPSSATSAPSSRRRLKDVSTCCRRSFNTRSLNCHLLGRSPTSNENAPCWIRTSDRLLRGLAVIGLKTLAVPSSEGLSGLAIEASASAKESLGGPLAAGLHSSTKAA